MPWGKGGAKEGEEAPRRSGMLHSQKITCNAHRYRGLRRAPAPARRPSGSTACLVKKEAGGRVRRARPPHGDLAELVPISGERLYASFSSLRRRPPEPPNRLRRKSAWDDRGACLPPAPAAFAARGA